MSLDEMPGSAGSATLPRDAGVAHATVDLGPSSPSGDGLQNAADGAFETRCAAHLFGSFRIDAAEFALPVGAIRGVVNEPDAYTPVPLSPPCIRGLFNLRDAVIPVLDLRVLFGFPDRPDGKDRKIAILEHGAYCVGLLFDDTGGIINGTGVARAEFQPNADGVMDVAVDGLLKLDNGARMVHLLDPARLLQVEKLPRVRRHAADDTKSQLGQRLNCITFQIGHTRCALDLRFVQEITDMPEVRKSQVAHGHTLGNIDLRGVTVPIVDFRAMMGSGPPYEFAKDVLLKRKLIVLQLPEGPIGLVVYSIDNIVAYRERDVLPLANVGLPRHDLLSGCLVGAADELIVLLDHEKLLSDPTLAEAARSCREVYPPKGTPSDAARGAAHSVSRATYILLRADMTLAIDISCVSEIINRPRKLLQPPYVRDYVDGILNLRGEIITLIDPRALYGLPAAEVADPKVLIFQSGDKKHGLVVDSVDEIVTVDLKDLVQLPELSTNAKMRIVSQDVKGCLLIGLRGTGGDAVPLLDVNKLVARCAEDAMS